MPLPELVKVTWLDSGAHLDHGWATAETYQTSGLSRHVVTVGHLMAEDEDTVAVGLTYDPDADHWYSVMLIYKPTIASIVRLQEVP